MPKCRALFLVVVLVSLVVFCGAPSRAQSGVRPKPTPTPEQEGQEPEQVFTEEVRIPVFASDEKGRADVALEVDDVLVIEDSVPQQVKSVRRIPASVVLLLDTGGDLNPYMRTGTTREIASGVLWNLREGDEVAALQFNARTQVLQDWTTDKDKVARSLKSKLASGDGANLSRAITRAVELLSKQPIGNRHLVLVTDGVDTGGLNEYQEAVKKLIASEVTLHVISYSGISEKAMSKQETAPKEAVGAAQSRADMATVGIDPTRPPGMRSAGGINPPSINSGIRIDPALKRRRKAYEGAMRKGEGRLKSLTDETGGRILLPATTGEMVAQGKDVAREIGTQYVVTYKPKRPLANSSSAEYREIRVGARRLGLSLRARRGYVVGGMRATE
ncbi:MAG: VWA domain-containing protein [Pyrinomonadaceae bacterium]